MRDAKITVVFLLLLMFLSGCQEGTISQETSDADGVRAWFSRYAPNYEVVDIEICKNGTYALLITFTPPGETEHYTMIRAYIVSKEEDGYAVDALKDTYTAGSAGFSAGLLGTEDMMVIFGDTGNSVYDFRTDTLQEVLFSELIVKLENGVEKNIPVTNDKPYIGIINGSAEVADIIFRTDIGDIHFSDYYSEPLNCSPDAT